MVTGFTFALAWDQHLLHKMHLQPWHKGTAGTLLPWNRKLVTSTAVKLLATGVEIDRFAVMMSLMKTLSFLVMNRTGKKKKEKLNIQHSLKRQ